MFSSVQLKRVATMTPGGRKKTVSALVVVGNKKGAVGKCPVCRVSALFFSIAMRPYALHDTHSWVLLYCCCIVGF